MMVFGGVGSMTGSLLGAYAFVILLEGLRVLPAAFVDWRYVIYPVILLVVMLFRPQGLLGSSEWGFLKPPRIAGRKQVQGTSAGMAPAESQASESQRR